MNTIQIEVQAIRVLEDLIAERGQWLIVYPSGRIEVLNGEQVEHRAPAPEPAPAPVFAAPITPVKRKHRKPHSRSTFVAEIGGKTISMPGIYHDIICAIAAHNNQPMTCYELVEVGGTSISS